MVLVVGDVMLDIHTFGEVNRLSPEAPVPIIDKEKEKVSLGAAANVAAQIASAGIKCHLAYKTFEVDCNDMHRKFYSMCSEASIHACPLVYDGLSSYFTTKERVWANKQQICRIDQENSLKPNLRLSDEWIEQLKTLIDREKIKIVVFSDYDKGTLTDYIIQSIVDFCYKKNIITILDPKRYSYWGLQNLFLIKPNKREVSITNMNVQEISISLQDTYLLNTLGKDGMKLWKNGACIGGENIHVKPNQVVDVCGSGDTVSAFLALSFLQDILKHRPIDIKNAMLVSSIAAAENTRHMGCFTLGRKQIKTIMDI